METVIGNKQVIETLRRHLRRSTVSHAYLFLGPAGVGKRLVAQSFAKTLLCEQRRGGDRPCEQCPSCTAADQGRHTDLVVLRRTEGDSPLRREAGAISVDGVRAFIERLALKPFGRASNVGIIEDGHDLTLEAANALLKLLEEPRGNTTLILTADDAESLPATVRSRCDTLMFSLVPTATIERGLTERGVSSTDAKRYAAFASGRPGIALTLRIAPQDDSIETAWRAAVELLPLSLHDRFARAEELMKRADDARATASATLRTLQTVLRLLLLTAIGAPPPSVFRPLLRGASVNERHEEALRRAIDRTAWSLRAMELNAQPKAALETAFLSLPRV